MKNEVHSSEVVFNSALLLDAHYSGRANGQENICPVLDGMPTGPVLECILVPLRLEFCNAVHTVKLDSMMSITCYERQ